MPSDYIVFRAEQIDLEPDDAWTAWKEIGRASAATPKSAIKQVTDGKPAAERTGTFVATPARSFQPVTRRVEAAEKEIWE